VKALLGNRKSLFVVGDDDQAIYGFRGADIGNINRFCDDFKESTLIRLEWNYRSTSNILHLANAIFENKPLRLRKVLRAGNPNGSGGNPLFRENREPEVWVSENPIEEMMKIICKIKELREAYDLAWKNFAILVRYNRQRAYYEEVLRDAELPVAGDETSDGEEVEDGIHIETVHASKGLQYAVVFYAGIAEGLTPGECTGSAKQRKKQLDEERRLYYVGVTRAEAYLILLYCKQRFWKGRLRNYRKSRFLPRKDTLIPELKMPVILFKIYVVVVVLSYMFIHILALPFVRIAHRGQIGLWIDKKIQSFGRFCMKVLRIDLSIEDQAILSKVDWTRPVFVMGNHNSYADIPIIFLAIERTIGFIAKTELHMIPFLNFWMKEIGCVFVNREKGGGAALIREAMAHGRAPRLFIFPEGTRGKDENMVPFKSGGFRLALEAEATILPVFIKGSGFAWEHRKDAKRKKVSVKVLEPLDVKAMLAENAKLDARKDLMRIVRERMEAAV
jgi:1-acyl-sn-glycerol-3-phosphate acyltransferase